MAMPDLLSIVEAAYSVDGNAQSWTGRLLDAADRSIGAGLAGFACMFQSDERGRIEIDRSSAAGIKQPLAAFEPIFDGLTKAPPGWLSSYVRDGRSVARCLMTSEADPGRDLTYRDDLARQGVHDGVNVACLDLDRRGLLLSLGVPARGALTPAARDDLNRVATHILAALRLRARLAAAAAAAVEPSPLANHAAGASAGARAATPAIAGAPDLRFDAVLTPDGRLLHAEGEATLAIARRALRAAVRDVEYARTGLRGLIPQALGLWKGLVSARWTLVDRFESDGKKYVVARENPPHAPGLSRLTRTERSVVSYALRGLSTKEIAYSLGVSPTTVRILIMRAARRFGVRSRDGLLSLARRDLLEATGRADPSEKPGE